MLWVQTPLAYKASAVLLRCLFMSERIQERAPESPYNINSVVATINPEKQRNELILRKQALRKKPTV